VESSINLIRQLAEPTANSDWQRFLRLYRPLLCAWMIRAGVAAQDVDDLTQDLLIVVFRKVGKFTRLRQGAFRSWLRTIVVYGVRDYFRAQHNRPRVAADDIVVRQLADLESADSMLSRQWDREHDEHVLRTLMQWTQNDFTPTTWEAFRRHVLDGAAPDKVAEELGLSLNAVLLAKSRVLKRLRRELSGSSE
jgi:RNA polymerase sigma-70 factor (ECF subfamily)